jgi:hypothetical protein
MVRIYLYMYLYTYVCIHVHALSKYKYFFSLNESFYAVAAFASRWYVFIHKFMYTCTYMRMYVVVYMFYLNILVDEGFHTVAALYLDSTHM